MKQTDFDFALFDLGGVLIHLGGIEAMKELTGLATEEEIWRRWLSCPWVRDFERGLVSIEEFGAGVVGEWGMSITPESFIDSFRAWPQGLIDGAQELVEAVGRNVRVGCVSNTNALHWADQTARWPLAEMFEVMFLSHKLGLIKPDRELFEHIVAALGVPPDRLAFLDDNALNVAQARSAGFVAIEVRGVEEARSALRELGLLPDRSAISLPHPS